MVALSEFLDHLLAERGKIVGLAATDDAFVPPPRDRPSARRARRGEHAIDLDLVALLVMVDALDLAAVRRWRGHASQR
jgi:hypothetical protein